MQIGIQLMVLGGILVPPEGIDWRGFYGHLYVWAPWFIVWGLLMGVTAFYYTRTWGALRNSSLGVAVTIQQNHPLGEHFNDD
jgi:hypothetical protein